MGVELIRGDAVEVMAGMPECSVDAVVCDPPFNWSFMNKRFDSIGSPAEYQRWTERWAREALRILKPGGYAFVCGGDRTYHRQTCGLEDAGFKPRTCVVHLHAQGFPKHKWQLKPAAEFWALVQKPYKGSAEANVMRWGTGGLNIDGCRIHSPGSEAREYVVTRLKPGATLNKTGGNWRPEEGGVEYRGQTKDGRWPANVLLSHAPGCTPVLRRVQHNGDAPPNSVNVSVILNPSDAQTGCNHQGVEGVVSGALACSAMLPGIEFNDQSMTRQQEVNDETAGIADDDVLMSERNSRRSQSVGKGKLGRWNTEDSSGDIHLGTVQRHGGSAPLSSDNRACARTEHPGSNAFDARRLDLEVLAADRATNGLPTLGGSCSVDVGAGTRASRSLPETQIGIGDAVDIAANGADVVVPGHGASLHADYTTLERGEWETVEAWECERDPETGEYVCPVALLDEQAGERTSGGKTGGATYRHTTHGGYDGWTGGPVNGFEHATYGDSGSASRFFFVSKASRSERQAGLPAGLVNDHPCIKPISLMRHLVKLVTPPGGTVLDCFAGSGSTGCAAVLEGFDFIGIDADAHYLDIARHRIAHWTPTQLKMPLLIAD